MVRAFRGSWFETRGVAALLTMRTSSRPHPGERRSLPLEVLILAQPTPRRMAANPFLQRSLETLASQAPQDKVLYFFMRFCISSQALRRSPTGPRKARPDNNLRRFFEGWSYRTR